MSIPLDIIDKLSEHQNIIGLKDSEQDKNRLEEAVTKYRNREDFVHQLGWAVQSVYGLSRGSDGLVPSTGNFVPGMYKELYESVVNKNMERAGELQNVTNSISKIYQTGKGLGHSLAALKVMMNEIGLCGTDMFPALTKLSMNEEIEIRKKVNEIRDTDNKRYLD